MKNKKTLSIWKIWSTGLVIICVLIIIFLVVMIIIGGDDNSILLNWGVYLPKPQSKDKLINNNVKILEIYNYEQSDIEEIIKSGLFKSINELDIDSINMFLDRFYEFLRKEEKDVFNINIDRLSLLIDENYYACIQMKNDEKTNLLLILDLKTNRLYCIAEIFR